jgi:hypothetical protein
MRNMSFALTTPQVLARTKTVTRRTGWTFLKPGDLIQAVEKGMGLKKGETVRRLAVLRVESVSRWPLREGLTKADVAREGFPDMSHDAFTDMFCRTHKGCTPDTIVTRIAFRYERVAP